MACGKGDMSLKNQMAERGCRINGITGLIVRP